MALVLEQEIEELAHLGIVLDDQDRAGAASRFVDRLADRRPDGRSAAAAALGWAA